MLNLDREIRTAMSVDKVGNIECIATQVAKMPEELMREFGGSWAAIAGGVFLQLFEAFRNFQTCHSLL